MTIDIDGLSINCLCEGEGEDVLLLHGWGSSSAAFRGIIDAISGKYRCIAPDFPGCGGSDTMKEPWTVDDYADFVVKLCDALSVKTPVIIGHSHGGRVAIRLASQNALSPSKLVLLDSAGLIPKKSLKFKVRASLFKLIKKILSSPILHGGGDKLLDRARAHFGSADYNAAPPVLRKTLVNLVNVDLRDSLPNISAPTLLIWGENDNDTPLSDAKIIESLIPDCGLCVARGAGHWAFVEQPVFAQAAIKSFLGVL